MKKRRAIVFVSSAVRAKQELSSPYFESCQLINENLLQVMQFK